MTVKVTEAGGANVPSDTETFRVTVANVAPVVELDGPDTVKEDATREYTFKITDPGNDEQSPGAKCGAGTLVPGSFQYDVATRTGSFECRFPDVTPDEDLVTPVTVTTNEGEDPGSDSIDVSVLNVVPTAVNDSMTTSEFRQVKANLLDNDEDPGQDLDRASMTLLSVEIFPARSKSKGVANATTSLLTAGGSVSIDELLDGNVTYKPNRGFVDTDSFRYRVCDDDGDCSRAEVEVADACTAANAIFGTKRADVLRGTPGDDVICALGGNDRIYGCGDDILVGGGGWDRMWAETGNDVTRGGSDTDAMDAGLGDETINEPAAQKPPVDTVSTR